MDGNKLLFNYSEYDSNTTISDYFTYKFENYIFKCYIFDEEYNIIYKSDDSYTNLLSTIVNKELFIVIAERSSNYDTYHDKYGYDIDITDMINSDMINYYNEFYSNRRCSCSRCIIQLLEQEYFLLKDNVINDDYYKNYLEFNKRKDKKIKKEKLKFLYKEHKNTSKIPLQPYVFFRRR